MSHAKRDRTRQNPANGSGPVVVVGYDGSAPSRGGAHPGRPPCRAEGKGLHRPCLRPAPDFRGSPNFDRVLSERRDHRRALLDAIPLTGNDELIDTEYETELIGGPPAQAIAGVARTSTRTRSSLGSRGLGSVRSLLGSVSHELLQIADRPVVVVPAEP